MKKKEFHFEEKKKKIHEFDVKDFVQYIKMSKVLTRTQLQSMDGDKYTKFEKAKFLLEQEGYELDKMLIDFEKGKDEINSFLKSSIQLKNIKSSGANAILENILKHLKSENLNFNYDELLIRIDKQFQKLVGENINSADVIHEITKQIMMKLDKSNKKKQIIEKQSLLKLTKNIKELDFDFGQIEKSTQTDFLKSKLRSSLSKIEYKRTAEEIKLEEDKAKYLKCREQKVKDLEFEKTSFLSMLDKKENKLMKKKDKIHNLRSLIAELREKLNHFSDKDLQNFTLLKMKEAYLQETKTRFFEKETQMLQKINEFQDQFDRKDLKIAELTDELSNLYLVIDFNKSKEPEFNEKSKFQSKRFFLKKGGKNDQMESKTYNCIDSESSDSSSKNKSINSKSKKGSLSPIRKKTVTLSSNLIEEEQKKNNSKDSRRKTSGSSIINFQASQLKSPLDQTRKKSNISLRIPASTPKRKSSITLKLTIPSKKISNNNIEITSNTLKSIDEFPREARKSVLKKGANAKSSANKVQSTLIRYIQQENASKKIEVKLSPKVDTFKKIEDKSSATIESSENSNDEKKIDKNKKKNQENPELYYPQNLILTNKYSKYRREKKLHSLYVKNSLTLQNVNNEHNGNNEIHFLKDENQFLFECIKRKNVIALFSNHIFPKNKIYKTKIELILEILMVHKKKSEYFDFLYSFLKNNNELPIQAQNKQIQTSNVFFLSKSTQTYPLPEKDANSKNSNELIEKINKKSHQFDILTTSIESRPDKHLKIPNVSLKPEKNNLISSENIANKESYYESKPKIKTQQHYNSKSLEQETNLDGSRNNSKTNIFQKNDNKPSQALNFYSIANKALTESDEFFKKTEFQNLSSINNEYFLNNRKNYNIIEEGESIGNSAPNLKTLEIKIEEKITKDVYEHIKLMNKNTDSNYSKLKFMFNYPFRSINAKFNEKEKNLESKQEENIQELTYDKFQMFFNNMLKIHKRCGTNCSHLKSFYKNIGFQIKIPYSRQEIILKKNIISQLPKIF